MTNLFPCYIISSPQVTTFLFTTLTSPIVRISMASLVLETLNSSGLISEKRASLTVIDETTAVPLEERWVGELWNQSNYRLSTGKFLSICIFITYAENKLLATCQKAKLERSQFRESIVTESKVKRSRELRVQSTRPPFDTWRGAQWPIVLLSPYIL